MAKVKRRSKKDLFLSGIEGFQRVCMPMIGGGKKCVTNPGFALAGKKRGTKAYNDALKKLEKKYDKQNVSLTVGSKKVGKKKPVIKKTYKIKGVGGRKVSNTGRITSKGPSQKALCALKDSKKPQAKTFYRNLADKGYKCNKG